MPVLVACVYLDGWIRTYLLRLPKTILSRVDGGCYFEQVRRGLTPHPCCEPLKLPGSLRLAARTTEVELAVAVGLPCLGIFLQKALLRSPRQGCARRQPCHTRLPAQFRGIVINQSIDSIQHAACMQRRRGIPASNGHMALTMGLGKDILLFWSHDY